MAEGVTTTGLREFREAVTKLPEAVQAAARRVALATGQQVATNARQRVRVRSGKLKSTIAVREDAAKREVRVSVGEESGPPIAVFLEYGTVHMDAFPFFTPALEQERHAYQRDLEAATATAAQRVMG